MIDQKIKAGRKNSRSMTANAQPEWLDIFNAIGHPALILDPHHNVIAANQIAIELAGKPLSEIQGKPCYRIYHSSDAATPPACCPMDTMLRSGHLETAEMEIEVGGRFFLVSCTPVFDTDGTLERIIHIAADITEHKHAEEALHQSEERYRELYEKAPFGYQSLDAEGRFLAVNQAWLDTLGYAREEVIGRWFGDFLAPEYVDPFRQRFPQFKAAGKVHSEFEMLRKDGSRRYIAFDGKIGYDQHGQFKQTHCILQDLTEQRKIAEEKRRREELFRAVFDQAPVGICLVDPAGHFIQVNSALCRMLGYSENELRSMTFRDVTHPDDLAVSDGWVQNLLWDKPTPMDLEKRYLHKAGHVVWGIVRSKLLRDADGSPLFFSTHIQDITERKQAEESLQESQQHASLLANLLERSSQPFAIKYPDGRMGICNEAFFKMLGYPKEELLALDWMRDLTPPEWLEKEHLILENLHQTGQPVRYKKEFIRKEGSRVPVELLVHLVKDEQGRPRYYYAFVTDITERKKAKDALRESEQRFSVFMDRLPAAVFMKDEEGRTLFANEYLQQLMGGKNWSGKTTAELFPPEIAAKINDDDQRVLTHGLTVQQEIIPDGKGRERTFETYKFPIYLPSGAVLLGGISLDISEQKHAEKALLHAEKRFRDLLENVRLAAIMLDLDGNITFCNDFFLTLTGWSRDEVLHKNWFDMLVPQELRETIKAMFNARILKAGMLKSTFPSHHENPIQMRDGSSRLLAWDNAVLQNPEGEVIGSASIGIDVTEQRKLEEQLRQSQKLEAIGQLAGGVAHDFNNILSAIVGYAQLSLMKMPRDDAIRNNLELILDASDKATTLTQSLLSFSRKQVINPQPHNLNDIIKRLQALLSRLIREDIAITSTCWETDLVVFIDSGQIEQILMNLVTNARDAMPHGGHIAIRAKAAHVDDEFISAHGYGRKGNYALLSVSDTGQGMDDKTKERIFEPFFTTKEQGKGTGLGLAMVYGAVKQHDGYIDVYSELGKGTTFKIYLPLFRGIPGEDQDESVPVALRGGSETVLIAEDDTALRELTLRVLHKYGYNVIEAVDGADAVARYIEQRERIQLIILDAIMPKKNGKVVYQEIRAINPSIKAIFVSGYAEDIIIKEGLLEPGIHFLLKPLNPSDLVKKVREVLDA